GVAGIRTVTIPGEPLHDPPMYAQLHLVAFRITDGSSGESVDELAERIAAHGIPREELLRILGADAPGIEGRRRRFEIEETRLYAVEDDGPGIRASHMDSSALRGTLGLNYRLSLDSCPGELDPSQLDRVLEEL